MSTETGPIADAGAERPYGGDRVQLTRRMTEAAFNDGDFTMARELTAPDAVTHDPSMPKAMQGMRGPEPFVQQASTYRAAFTDMRFTVEDTIAEDDKVVVRWRAEGTHTGDLQGLAPTGVRATATGISIVRWQGDKAVEFWVQWDNLGLARQIGAAPPEGGLGERLATAVQRVMAKRRRGRK